jgi:hypothetical protein
MNWTRPPGTENQPASLHRLKDESRVSPLPAAPLPPGQPEGLASRAVAQPAELKIGKTTVLIALVGQPTNVEVFTLTLAGETIELRPFKSWIQLDHFKWTARGKLPAEPAGLEITPTHLRLAGETVAVNDPAGGLKLERLFNDWLMFERETSELVRKKAKPATPLSAASGRAESQALRFRVEIDKHGQVHVNCLHGRDILASVGLTVAGFNSLHQQGLLRKPHTLQTGALHDWIELDGDLFSFEKGRNDGARLEQVLNQRYVAAAGANSGKEISIFVNEASSTGFDIQFPELVAGAPQVRRQHLNDYSLDRLQDAAHCGLLHKEIIVKLIPPNLVFKQRTPDGGEEYLAWGPEHTVAIPDEEGHVKSLQLSRPLNLLHLSAAELTAVFNHPAINRHSQRLPAGAQADTPPPAPTPAPLSQDSSGKVHGQQAPAREAPVESRVALAAPGAQPGAAPRVRIRVDLPVALPNAWLKEILAQPILPHDWFACLVYTKMAEHFGVSDEGQYASDTCWFIRLGGAGDVSGPGFKGIFLTQKGSLGFLNQGQMARFGKLVASIGSLEAPVEGLQIRLLAVGLDAHHRVVFILSNNYRAHFGVPEDALAAALGRLRDCGALVLSAAEALTSYDPIEVVWTVPALQADPAQPRALESVRPLSA